MNEAMDDRELLEQLGEGPDGKLTAEDSPSKPKAEGKASRGKGKRWGVARHTVQVAILLLFLAPVIACGWELAGMFFTADAVSDRVATPSQMPFYGSLSSSSVGPVTLLDPFATLQTIVAAKTVELSWILGALIPLAFFALVRGRAFCGWACPVNLVLEVVDFLRKKLLRNSLPERVIPRHAKVWVALAVLALSAAISIPVFEAVSPISFINKGLVFGSVVGGMTLLAIVLAELFWGHRVWCRSICPLGGFYEIVGKVGLVKVAIDHDKCVKCRTCRNACLCDPEILEEAISGATDKVCACDCMVCGSCIDACPSKALSMKIGR